MTDYDWSERLIRQLVYSDHVPRERDGSILCSSCHEPWPCTMLKSLRAWVAAGGYDDTRWACGESHKCPRCGYMIGRSEREQK